MNQEFEVKRNSKRNSKSYNDQRRSFSDPLFRKCDNSARARHRARLQDFILASQEI